MDVPRNAKQLIIRIEIEMWQQLYALNFGAEVVWLGCVVLHLKSYCNFIHLVELAYKNIVQLTNDNHMRMAELAGERAYTFQNDCNLLSVNFSAQIPSAAQ